VTVRLGAARRALDPAIKGDLRDLRVAALAFKVVVSGDHPIVVAHAVDDEGDEHWLAVRGAPQGRTAAYLKIFSQLLRRGLRARGPMLVDADGCTELARSIDRALGPVVHAGRPRVAS
jgi:hypothetical protein